MHGTAADARRELAAADLHRRLEPAQHDREHGPQPQRLLDHRVDVGLVARAQPRPRVRVAGEPLERPRQRGRRRLVAGDQQRHELVAQLGVGHRRAVVLVAGAEQHREHVVALGDVGRRAAARDLLARSPRRARAITARYSGMSRDALRARRRRAPRAGTASVVQSSIEVSAARRRSSPLASETPKIARMTISSVIRCIAGRVATTSPPRPGGDLRLGGRRHQLAVGLHPLAVERRQQQLALGHVRAVVEQQDGVRADDRPQDPVRLARVQQLAGRR